MQFNTRDGRLSTWDHYGVDGNHDGTKNIYDPEDAIAAPANHLRQAHCDRSQAISATTIPRPT